MTTKTFLSIISKYFKKASDKRVENSQNGTLEMKNTGVFLT